MLSRRSSVILIPSLVIQCMPDTGSKYMDGEAVKKFHPPNKFIHSSRLRGLKLFIIPSQKWMDGCGFFDIVVHTVCPVPQTLHAEISAMPACYDGGL